MAKLKATPVLPLAGTPVAGQPVHYRHDREGRRTYAVVAPTRYDLTAAVKCMKHGDKATVSFHMGVARVHPKDNYCKRTGRETAENNIVPVTGYLQHVYITPVGTTYVVLTEDLVQVDFFRKHGHKSAKVDYIHPNHEL